MPLKATDQNCRPKPLIKTTESKPPNQNHWEQGQVVGHASTEWGTDRLI